RVLFRSRSLLSGRPKAGPIGGRLRRRVWRAMAINYGKLLALKIPDAEHSYGDKDTMLYALGVGLGHDPTDRAQLDFVYEKNLKALPTFACLLGYPGFWVRDLDTGIDWVRIVNGEQGFTLNAPVKPRGIVVGRTRIVEDIDTV